MKKKRVNSKEILSSIKLLSQKIIKLAKNIPVLWKEFDQKNFQAKKRRIKMKKKLKPSEYRRYLLQEFLKGGYKTFLFYLVCLLIILFLIHSIIHGIAGLFHSKSSGEKEAISETAPTPAPAPKTITIGSTGCMLLHDSILESYQDENGNFDFSPIFQYIAPYYSAPDFMTCEFEGALGGDQTGYSGYPMFHSPDNIIEVLSKNGIDLQFLATNHVYDALTYGFHRTMETYEKLNIPYSGIRQSTDDKPYYVASINGIKVGFINYVYETMGYGAYTNINGIDLDYEDQQLINVFDYSDLDSFYDNLQENIQNMKEDGAEFIIAQMHWGTEYQLEESEYQQTMAQKMCDLGVQALIGGHPHCEQPIDVLESSDSDNKMFCIYSEGNALSNQRKEILSEEMPEGHTEDGAMITLTLLQKENGDVCLSDIDLLPTWVYRYEENDTNKYFILPLDQVDTIETTTGIKGIKNDALASYNRTMEELGPGLEKAKQFF